MCHSTQKAYVEEVVLVHVLEQRMLLALSQKLLHDLSLE
jgi:hypothetical protein